MLHVLLAALLLAPGFVQERTDTTFSAAGVNALELDNMNGSVLVRGWDRNEIRVRATHGAGDYIEIQRGDDVVDIEPENDHSAPGAVQFEIDVPARLAVRIDGINQPARVEGVDGAVEVESVNGDIHVRGGRGTIELETVEGTVTLEGASGRISLSSVNQGIRVSDSSGRVDAETVNGPISLTRMRSEQVSASSVNGTVAYEGTLARTGSYALSSHNGTVELRVPAGTNADVIVSTHNGEFEVDFPVQVRDREARGRFQFQIGAGGARVELDSFGGNVRVLRTR